MSMNQWIRTVEHICEDALWPGGGGLGGPDPEESLRHQAIADVLRRIPEDGYQRLKAITDTFTWYVPHRLELAKVTWTPCNYEEAVLEGEEPASFSPMPGSRVLYLSPILEMYEFPLAISVVAHELAHLALGHKILNPLDRYQQQEEEAWALVRKWGFEKEASVHEAWVQYLDRTQAASVFPAPEPGS